MVEGEGLTKEQRAKLNNPEESGMRKFFNKIAKPLQQTLLGVALVGAASGALADNAPSADAAAGEMQAKVITQDFNVAVGAGGEGLEMAEYFMNGMGFGEQMSQCDLSDGGTFTLSQAMYPSGNEFVQTTCNGDTKTVSNVQITDIVDRDKFEIMNEKDGKIEKNGATMTYKKTIQGVKM